MNVSLTSRKTRSRPSGARTSVLFVLTTYHLLHHGDEPRLYLCQDIAFFEGRDWRIRLLS